MKEEEEEEEDKKNTKIQGRGEEGGQRDPFFGRKNELILGQPDRFLAPPPLLVSPFSHYDRLEEEEEGRERGWITFPILSPPAGCSFYRIGQLT